VQNEDPNITLLLEGMGQYCLILPIGNCYCSICPVSNDDDSFVKLAFEIGSERPHFNKLT